jgi:hypothetical protein
MPPHEPSRAPESSDHVLRNLAIAIVVALLAVNLYTGLRMSRLTIGIVSVDFAPAAEIHGDATPAPTPYLTAEPSVWESPVPTSRPPQKRAPTPAPEQTSTPAPERTRTPAPEQTSTPAPEPTASAAADPASEPRNEKGLTLDEYLACVQTYEPDCGSVPE